MGDAVGQSPKYALEARFLSAGGPEPQRERKASAFAGYIGLRAIKKDSVSISTCCREEM